MQQTIALYGPLKPFTADAAEDLVARTAKDKKNRSGSRSFVLPTGIGHSTVVRDVSEAELLTVTSHDCARSYQQSEEKLVDRARPGLETALLGLGIS